ncbi:hypothetical protein [Microvirga massiliensis]|uniref:hypothetical protein n=1 Tax=Microvirga massiliensis TaxID=1033741 RepID=UPI00062B9DF3|nr:hypothetical protein [Microvirga massiliensis]
MSAQKELMKLFEIVRVIRDEQTSNEIFGGEGTEKKREASRVYAVRIMEQAKQIDGTLEAIEQALEAEGKQGQ